MRHGDNLIKLGKRHGAPYSPRHNAVGQSENRINTKTHSLEVSADATTTVDPVGISTTSPKTPC